VVDPPPPAQAAGSSLLFSREFYALAQRRLNPGGIVQMWFPGSDDAETAQAVLRSMRESFPHVRCFASLEGWGMHLLGSLDPMPQVDAKTLAARMPESAKKDLLEWNPGTDAAAFLGQLLKNEYSVPASLNPDPAVEVTDDRPFNEYFLLRQFRREFE